MTEFAFLLRRTSIYFESAILVESEVRRQLFIRMWKRSKIVSKMKVEDNRNVPLSLKILRKSHVFNMLFYGWICSLIVFLMENFFVVGNCAIWFCKAFYEFCKNFFLSVKFVMKSEK